METSHAASWALLASVALCCGCATPPAPAPTARGDWHFSGGSRGVFEVQDGGDFGDRDRIAAEASGGRFASERLLLEALLSVSLDSAEDDATGADADTTVLAAGAGLRYYFDSQSLRRPYAGIAGALADFDIDVDGGIDDSDVVPLVQVRVGLETFLTETVALDVGAGVQHAFGLDLGGVEDDLTTYGVSAGISIWP